MRFRKSPAPATTARKPCAAPRRHAARSARPVGPALLAAAAATLLAAGLATAQGTPAPPARTSPPAAKPAAAPAPTPLTATPSVRSGVGTRATAGLTDNCAACHDYSARRLPHPATQKRACAGCHVPATGGKKRGRCQSQSVQAWQLAKPVQELCTECHGEVMKKASSLTVRHDVLNKGRCAQCHDPHGADQPVLLRASGKALCLRCHSNRSPPGTERRIDLSKRVVHRALEKNECQDCHDAGHGGKNAFLLKKNQPELCYGCHKRMDQGKAVHTAVRQGECLVCHDPHSSDHKGLLKKPRDQVCFACHEVEPLLTRPVKHAPVAEGKCLDCHDSHNAELPRVVLLPGKQLCLKCHDARSPKGKGTPSEKARIDFTKKVQHKSVVKGECQDCHVSGHSGDNLKLLRQPPADLCYKCHNRKDTQRYTHSALRVGDCAVCHLPHTTDNRALLSKPALKDVCFTCHQDDVTGRAAVHKPVGEGKCDECHNAHGAQNRNVLTRGEGKAACYSCHKVVDNVKVRHAALDRYGCAVCHDPHGAGQKFLLPKNVNALCISCHPDKPDGRHVTAMVPKGHVVGGPIDPRRPDHAFTCASCHNPHGSDSPRLFYVGDNAMESCDACHGDRTGKHPELKNVISRAKANQGSAGGGGPGGGAPGAGGPGAGGPGGGAPEPGAGSDLPGAGADAPGAGADMPGAGGGDEPGSGADMPGAGGGDEPGSGGSLP
ncbi:cytochrome c3 family protein [Anaeromyxobacter paludicola]|uniref:Doubled CXXCH motif domain-containing protein n=1 Tax=Anaeromyxobacter paludicola TaxID=2918171 RepID=A0ABM7X6H6_9BACT|nr:cytochrome c3 family protein [Anaeromyxobacter paludicola]BDG07415.1 hypothetical protein AMPC_05280 [Anaeromyxobacter paludicola]